MAVQWADSFSRYGTGSSSQTAMLAGLPYASFNGQDGTVEEDPDPNAQEGSRCLLLARGTTATTDIDNRIALPTPVTGTVGVCFRLWLENLPATDSGRNRFIQFRTVSNIMCTLRVEQNGSIRALDPDNNVIADTGVPVISPQSWNHMEAIYDSVLGEGSLYINGIQRLTWDGLATGNTIAILNMSPRTGASAETVFIKDLVIWDGTGSENNSVMGTVIVGRLNPNSDISLGGWTPSTGVTGFNLLAKDAPNDATFLSADDSPPAEMVFGFEDLPPDVTSVRAVITVSRHRKVDGGDGNIQTAVSPNGTDWDNGENRPITTAFQYDFDVSEINPATASAWTPVAVDSIQGRVDRTV